MRLRRKRHARHLAAEDEDLVIDLRERLAPYGRPEVDRDEDNDNPTPTGDPTRRTRPLRSR